MVAARTPNVISLKPSATLARGDAPKQAVARAKRPSAGWEAKLRPELTPRVVEDRRRGGTLLLPTPQLVGEVVKSIPRGHVMTMGALRRILAARFEADSTCPLMTGIFATILAGAVVEDLVQRHRPRWPIWRLVRDDGTLAPKWPLDPLYRATMLRQEGVRLTRRKGHWAAIDTQQC